MNDTVRKAEQIYQEGLALMNYKYYANALSYFEQAVDLNPDFAQAWFQIGRCRSELVQRQIQNTNEYLYAEEMSERYQGAIEAYQKAIELQPDYADARNSLAELFFYFGESQSEESEYPSDYMQAIEWYKQAAEVNDDWGAAYHQIGQAYRCLMENCEDDEIRDLIDFDGTIGIAEARIENYQQLIEIQPDDARAYYELGEAYTIWIYPFITVAENYGDETSDEIEAMKQDKHPEIQGVLTEAIEAYRTAVRIKPNYGEAYNELAEACQRVGQIEEAIQAFKQAIVLGNMYCIDKARGRLERTDIETVRWNSYNVTKETVHRNLAEAYHDLGKQNFADGNYIQAIECYHSAIVADLHYDAVYYDLAVADDEAGRYELAILWYRRVRHTYDYPDFHYRLGKAWHRIGRYQDAVEAYEKAIDRQITVMEEHERQAFLSYMPEPAEYPAWWTDVFQNKELARCRRPLQDAEIEQWNTNEKF